MDFIPSEEIESYTDTNGYGYSTPMNKKVCVYSTCPYSSSPEKETKCKKCLCNRCDSKPEPSPEALEESEHQKEIKRITRSTQKLVYELQHSKLQLSVLKIQKEIEALSSPASSPASSPCVETDSEMVIEQE